MKNRILVISERYRPENFLLNDLVDHWNKQGFVVSVLTQVPSYPADRLFSGYPNVNRITIESGIRVNRFKSVLGYKRSIVRKIMGYVAFMLRACLHGMYEIPRHDYVFVYHTGPLTQAMPLVLAKFMYRKRTVIWTQDVWPDTVFAYGLPDTGTCATILKMFVRVIYAGCDQVCVSSKGFIDRVQPYIHKKSTVAFVPQWVPDVFLSKKQAPFDFCSKAKRFIFTGNVGTMQNLEIVVKAFCHFDPEAAHLYIVGDGSRLESLERLAMELQCNSISFFGSIPHDQVLSCIRQCDFALLSLIDDPLINMTVPAKFQAYLVSGKPILAVCKGEARSMIEASGLGVGADPSNEEDIIHAIQSCIDLPEDRYRVYARNMKLLYEEKYNRTTILQHLDRIVLEK